MAKVTKRGTMFTYENRAQGKLEKYRYVDGKFYKVKADGTLASSSVNNPLIRAALNKEIKNDSYLVERVKGTPGKAQQRLNPAMKQNKQRMSAMQKDADMMAPKTKPVPVPKQKPAEPVRRKMDALSSLLDTVTKPLPKPKPRGTVDQSKKRPPQQEIKPTSTQARVRTKQAKRITAGPNVGFGPKGNIFPSSAAERRELMSKYGGTGSAAAKAAAAGKQGNLSKVKASKGAYMKKRKK